jgi:hypothetical protein
MMKKFLVLYESPTSANELMSKSSPEQMKAGMDAWEQWKRKTEKDSEAEFDYGMPLDTGKRISASGEVSDSDLTVTGYSILQAKSLDDAIEKLKDHPHFKTPGGASIVVAEYLGMPGIE